MKVTGLPWQTACDMGCVLTVGPVPGLIVKLIFAVWLGAPLATPVKVIVYVPLAKVLVPVNVTVELGLPVVNGLVPNTTVVPPGLPEDDNVIGLTNPLLKVAFTVPCIEGPAGQADGAGEMALRVKSGAAAVTVKFELLIS